MHAEGGPSKEPSSLSRSNPVLIEDRDFLEAGGVWKRRGRMERRSLQGVLRSGKSEKEEGWRTILWARVP